KIFGRRENCFWLAAMLMLPASIGQLQAHGLHGEHAGESTYVHNLLESGNDKELVSYLDEHRPKLHLETSLWRSLLPELKGHGLLDSAAPYLEETWKDDTGDAETSFALAELRLFEEKFEDAEAIFWQIFEMSEEELA